MTKFDIMAVGAGAALAGMERFCGYLLSIQSANASSPIPISTPWLWAVFWSPGQKRNFS